MPHRNRDLTPRLISPGDLVGAATVASLLKIDRSTLLRRIDAGKVPFLAQLDGANGAYVFDINDIQALVAEESKGEHP